MAPYNINGKKQKQTINSSRIAFDVHLLTSILYGVFVSGWLDDVDGLSTFGGPIGELSSKMSPNTRNLIGSPISM